MIRSQHQKINYSQSWEDADLLLQALPVQPADRIFSITSGGCNTLALASQSAGLILATDINQAQNYLLELKLKSIQTLNYQDLLEFLGVCRGSSRKELYHTLSGNLTNEARHFWDGHMNYISAGIIHCGRFERYLQLFRKYILSLIHSRKTIRNLLVHKTKPSQSIFYRDEWDSPRWRMLFRIFFSRRMMQWLGRSPEMFRYSRKEGISDHYLSKTYKAFTSNVLFNNSYIDYILLGGYHNSLPYYLRPDAIGQLKSKINPIQMRTGHILDILKEMPDNYFSRFNLSDVFEPLQENVVDLIFHEILRTGEKDARIIFWNNLVRRDVSKELVSFFHREEELEMQLIAREKVFFYENLNIYTLIK